MSGLNLVSGQRCRDSPAGGVALLICEFVAQHCDELYSPVGYGTNEASGGISSNRRQRKKRDIVQLIRKCCAGSDIEFASEHIDQHTIRQRLSIQHICNIVCMLCRKLRETIAPHTQQLPLAAMLAWDIMYTSVLLFSIFREHPSVGWERALLQLLAKDLLETEPYDGSAGPVKELYCKCAALPEVVLAMASGRCGDATRLSCVGVGVGANATHEPDKDGKSMLSRSADSLWRAFLSKSPNAAGDRGSYIVSATCAHSPFPALEFEPSPLLRGDSALDGWSLMHFLASTIATIATPVVNAKSASNASVQNRVVEVLLAAGVRLAEKDFSGRTPLHVACSVLHIDMILCLIGHGSSVLLEDAAGHTALDTFLRTLSVCNWRYYNIHSSSRTGSHASDSNQSYKNYKKCTSEQVAQCIISLTGHDVGRFWRIQTVRSEGAHRASCAGAYASNPLVLAIRCGDSVVIKTIVSSSKMCPKSDWHINVVRHCLLLAIKAGRVWLLELLWNTFAAVLDDFHYIKDQMTHNEITDNSIAQWVFFMHSCMAAAVVSNSCSDAARYALGVEKQIDSHKTDSEFGVQINTTILPGPGEVLSASKSMLEFLFRRTFQARLKLSESGDERKLFEENYCDTWLPFLHVSVLRTGSQMILDTFLNSDCISVRHVIGSLRVNSARGFFADLSQFWFPFAEQEGVRAACQLMSPLALAFYLHENTAATKLLSFVLLTQKGAPLSAAQCISMQVSPFVACALSCNFDGLQLLQAHMGSVAFVTAANTPDSSGIIALHALLHAICEQRRVAVARLGEVPAIRSRESNANPYQHANQAKEASILTLQLDPGAAMKTVRVLVKCVPAIYLASDTCFSNSVSSTSVWEVRRRQLQERLGRINIRIGEILLPNSIGTISVHSAAVVAYLDNLLAQESRNRKDEIFRSIQHSLQAWDIVQQTIETTNRNAHESSTNDFSCNMRALYTLYSPKQKHCNTILWAKIVHCVTLVLEQEVYGSAGSRETVYTGVNPGDAWKRLRAIIGGHEGSSRSSVTRKLLELRKNLVSFRDPFISELVSGRTLCTVGKPMQPNSRRVIGKDTWLLLHRHMPHPATNFTTNSPDLDETGRVLSEVPSRVNNSTMSNSEGHNLSPRVSAAFNSLLQWLKAIYNDGNMLYSGAYNISASSDLNSIQQGNGLTHVVELLSLVEGRTRVEASLQRFPLVAPLSEEPALSVLLGILLQSTHGSSSKKCLSFLPLTQAAHQPAEINRVVQAFKEISNEATHAGLRATRRSCQSPGSYSAMMSLAEDVAVSLINSLAGNRNFESITMPTIPVLRSQFLSYLVSCNMWRAATSLLHSCKAGLIILEDTDISTSGGKSHLSGYPTLLAGSCVLDEMDYVGCAGLSSEICLSSEEPNISLAKGSRDMKGNGNGGWLWSWADCDIFSLTEVHPLHFAIRANNYLALNFIDAFFAAFPDTSLDAMSLAMLARHCGAGGDSAHGSTFERVVALANILEVPVTADLQTVYLAHGTVTLGLTLHGVRRSRLCGAIGTYALRANGHYKPYSDFELACMRRVETSLFHAITHGVEINAMQLSHGKNTFHADSARSVNVGVRDVAESVVPQTGGQWQGLCVLSRSFSEVFQAGNSSGPGARISNTSKISKDECDASPRIALMDSTSVPLSQFHNSIFPLLRALPVPVVACGVNQSGHTLLHSLGEGGGLRVAHRLIKNGAWRTLAVDRFGFTPVHKAISGGDLGLATSMLDHALKQTHEPEPIHRLYARHSALPHREIMFSILQQYAKSQREAAERDYFGRSSLKAEGAAPSVDTLDVTSLASGGLNLSTVSSSQDLLVYTMHRAAVAWRHIAKQDFSRLLQLSRQPKAASGTAEGKSNTYSSHNSSDIVLDSVVRARSILDLLHIPVSQLPLSSAAGPQSGTNPRTSPLSNLWDRISPSLLQERISAKIAPQIKSHLLGWYMRRDKNLSGSGTSARCARKIGGVEQGRMLQLADDFFLRHALNKSCVQLGLLSEGGCAGTHIEYADWEGEEQIAASSQESAGAEYKDYYDKSYVGFGENQTQFGAKDNKMYNERIFKHHSSAASQNLMQQLIIETRAAEFTKKYADNYSVPGSAVTFIQDQALEADKLVQFMKQWRADASGLQQALILSYKIMDWARLIYLARTLVSITSVPPSADEDKDGSWEHPLETRHRHWRACVQYELQVKRIVLPSLQGEYALPAGGLRIRICDLLETTDLAHFFRSASGASERFAALQGLVTKSLICCCLMLGRDVLASFVGQVSRLGSPDVATSSPASVAALLAMRVDEDGGNSTFGLAALLCMLQKLTIPSILARSEKQDSSARADCARQLTVLAKALQTFDLDTSASLALGGLPTFQPVKQRLNRNEEGNRVNAGSIPGYLSDNKAVLARAHWFGAPNGNGTRNATDADADARSVFGVLSTKSEIESAHTLGGPEAVDKLHKAYSTANAIGWMMQAVAGVLSSGAAESGAAGLLAGGRTISPSAIYTTLVQDWHQLSNLRNPLCLVSLPAGVLATFQRKQRSWLIQLSEYRQRRLATLLLSDQTHESTPAEALTLGSLTGWKLPPYAPLSSWITQQLGDTALGLTCCAQLLELGCQPTAIDGNKRTPLAVAAILGRPQLLREMLQYSTDNQLEKLVYLRRHLCWHVLMACPTDDVSSSSLDCSEDAVMRDSSAAAFETCVRLLRNRGFSFSCPWEDKEHKERAHLSCLQLALLKRLKWVTVAICEEMKGASSENTYLGKNATPIEDRSLLPAFGPLHLAVVWPSIQLDMLARIIDCLYSQPTLVDPLQHFSMKKIFCAEAIEQDIHTHADFMARQCGVVDGVDDPDTEMAASIMRDVCMGLVIALESSFSPHERVGVTTECALWRAARVNIGQLLLLAIDTADSAYTHDAKNQPHDNFDETKTLMTPSKKSGSPSPSKRYGRLTPGKVRQLQHETDRLQSELKSTTTDWNLFDLVVCTRRKDVTNLIFRRFRLYGEGSKAISQRYPSPLRLSLLGCFYNSPHVLLAVSLYADQHEHKENGVLGMRHLLGMREHLALAFTRRDGAVTPLEVACLYGYSDIVRNLIGTVGVGVPWFLALDTLIYSRLPEEECLLLIRASLESDSVVRNRQSLKSDEKFRLIPLLKSPEEPAEIQALRRLLNTPVRSLLLELPRVQKDKMKSSDSSASAVSPGETLLHFCARRGHARVIRYLIDNGASVHARDAHGYMPLQVAVIFGHSRATQAIGAEHPHLRRSMQWLCMHVRCWLLRRQARHNSIQVAQSNVVIEIDKPKMSDVVSSVLLSDDALVETSIQRAEREAEFALIQATKNHESLVSAFVNL